MSLVPRWMIRAVCLLAVSGHCMAQQPSCPGPADPQVVVALQPTLGNDQLFDRAAWQVCNAMYVNLGVAHPRVLAVLLKSAKQVGETGLGDPAYGVDFILAKYDKRLYRYTDTSPRDHYMDSRIVVHDLTGQGTPVVTFHSGMQGVSDSWTREHLVFLAPGDSFATDISPQSFGMSRRSRLTLQAARTGIFAGHATSTTSIWLTAGTRSGMRWSSGRRC